MKTTSNSGTGHNSGVRPSSAAATSDGLSALDDLTTGELFDISAAEDGRTPLSTYKATVLMRRNGLACALVLLTFVSPKSARAADTTAGPTPAQLFQGGTKPSNNWIELSVGGLATSGDRAQAQQRQQMKQGAFGGIEDLHYQQDIDKQTQFNLDAHSIFDQHDYSVSLGVKRENTGFIRFG